MSFQPQPVNMNPIAMMQLLAAGMNGMNSMNSSQTFHHVFESSSLNFNIEMTLKLIPKVQTPQVETQPKKSAIQSSQSSLPKTTGKRKKVQFNVPQPVAPVAPVAPVQQQQVKLLPVNPVPFGPKPIVVDEMAKRNNKWSLNKMLPFNAQLLNTMIPTLDNKFLPVQLLVALNNSTFTSQPYKYKDVVYHVVDLSDAPSTDKPCNLVLLAKETFTLSTKLMKDTAIQNFCRDLELGQDIVKVNVTFGTKTCYRRCVTGRGLVKLCARLFTDDPAIKQTVDNMLYVSNHLRWRFNSIDTVDTASNDSDASDTDTDME